MRARVGSCYRAHVGGQRTTLQELVSGSSLFLRQRLACFSTAHALATDSPVFASHPACSVGSSGGAQDAGLAQLELLPAGTACRPSCFFLSWASHGICCNDESRHIWLLSMAEQGYILVQMFARAGTMLWALCQNSVPAR